MVAFALSQIHPHHPVVEEHLLLADHGPRNVFAFATHYFFSVFLICLLSTTTESSVFLDVSCGVYAERARLACFGALALVTLLFFL